MSVVKFPKAKRAFAVPGDLAIGVVAEGVHAVLLVESVDDEGFVATVRDRSGVAALYRVVDVEQGVMIAAAATLTEEGRVALRDLVGDPESLKIEFRKYATEAAGQAWSP